MLRAALPPGGWGLRWLRLLYQRPATTTAGGATAASSAAAIAAATAVATAVAAAAAAYALATSRSVGTLLHASD